MRIKSRASLLCLMSLFVLGTAFANEQPVQVQFIGANGDLMVGGTVGVLIINDDGTTEKRVVPADPDGVYDIDLNPGQKAEFSYFDNTQQFDPVEVQIPVSINGPVAITLQTPPANDSCDTAEMAAVPSVVAGSTIGATDDPEAGDECGTSISAPSAGVWYDVVGTGNILQASTCGLDSGGLGGSDFDTKLSVYCQDCAELTCIDGNDDSPNCGFPDFQSTIQWCSQAGATYRVFVHGFGTATGDFNLALDDTGTPCDAAIDCFPPEPTGACCVSSSGTALMPPSFAPGETPVTCSILTATECMAAGGAYQGDDTPCVVPDPAPTVYLNDTVVPIPDALAPGAPAGIAESSITVPDDVTIADLNVGFATDHTWIGDLIIDVQGPDGFALRLWSQACNIGPFAGLDTFFDDAGTAGFCNGAGSTPPPGDGNERFAPALTGGEGDLAEFNGRRSGGAWTVFVSDNFPADTGSITRFELEITAGTPICPNFDCPAGGGGDEDEEDEEDETDDEEDEEDEDDRVTQSTSLSGTGDIQDIQFQGPTSERAPRGLPRR